MFHQEIKRGRAEVGRATDTLKQGIKQAKRKQLGLQEEVTLRVVEMKRAIVELQNVRAEAFTRVVGTQENT